MISIRYDGHDHFYIKLFYKIRNWQWFHDPATRDMFIWLLLHANRDEEYFHGVLIRRGQRATSYGSMAEDLGFTTNQMRRAEKTLKSTGEITVKKYPRFQVITVVNFEKYQAPHRQDHTQPTGNPQATHNDLERIRDIKSEERIKSPADAGTPSAEDAPDDPPIGSPEWYRQRYNDDWGDDE